MHSKSVIQGLRQMYPHGQHLTLTKQDQEVTRSTLKRTLVAATSLSWSITVEQDLFKSSDVLCMCTPASCSHSHSNTLWAESRLIEETKTHRGRWFLYPPLSIRTNTCENKQNVCAPHSTMPRLHGQRCICTKFGLFVRQRKRGSWCKSWLSSH